MQQTTSRIYSHTKTTITTPNEKSLRSLGSSLLATSITTIKIVSGRIIKCSVKILAATFRLLPCGSPYRRRWLRVCPRRWGKIIDCSIATARPLSTSMGRRCCSTWIATVCCSSRLSCSLTVIECCRLIVMIYWLNYCSGSNISYIAQGLCSLTSGQPCPDQ